MNDRRLEERLRQLPVPEAEEAEERAWRVVRAAHAERQPVRPPARVRRLAVALAASVAVLALALTPAGAEVVDVVREVVGIDEQDAKPVLGALPAAGELLVHSGSGTWIVREDGSKRLLGVYGEATWSPHGLFVAAAAGRQLVAFDPLGEVRWTVTAPAEVRDPRWSPSGFRIAYRSGGDLRVVAGDGTGDHIAARDVAPVAPAWRPVPEAKVESAGGGPGTEQVTFVDGGGRPRLVDADSEMEIRLPGLRAVRPSKHTGPVDQIAWTADGTRLLILTERILIAADPNSTAAPRSVYRAPPGNALDDLTVASSGDRVAVLVGGAGDSQLRLLELGAESARGSLAFAGPGRIADATFSPDGRWLLAGWRDADQWLFIRSDRPNRLVAIDDVTRQFDPGGSGEVELRPVGFPEVEGWIQPQR